MSREYQFTPKSPYFAAKNELMAAQNPACLGCPEAQRETVVAAVKVYMGEVALDDAVAEVAKRVRQGCKLEKPSKYTINPADAPVCEVPQA